MTTPELFIMLLLAALAWVLVTCVLAALAARMRSEIERHDMLVQAKRRQLQRQQSSR